MRDYKFVVLKDHAERANTSARSHAMRNALQQRAEALNLSSLLPYSSSGLTTQSPHELTGRFRIVNGNQVSNSRIHEGKTEPKNHSRPESSEEAERNDKTNSLIIGNPSMRFTRAKSPISAFHNDSVDPFDTLPAPSSKAVDLLTKYFMHELKLNISTVNPKKTWIRFALTDRTVYNATLTFAATAWNVHMAMSSPWLLRAGYHHKGLTIHLVCEKLNHLPHIASDEVICAVAILVNVETLAGNFDVADTHLKGLKSLVEARGGIKSLKENFIVERAVTWVDVYLAVSYGRQPLFPPIHDINDVYLPEALVILSNHSQLAGMIQQGPGTRDLLYILRLLRLIVVARSEIREEPQFHNTIRVLMLRTDRCILRLLMMCENDPLILSLVRIANSASHVFLHGALRNMPKNCSTFQILLQRLRKHLEQGYEHEFSSVGSSIVLLWALVVGVATTYDLPEHNTWFVLRSRAEFLMFKERYSMDRSQLEQCLNSFVGLEAMCLPVLNSLWAQFPFSS